MLKNAHSPTFAAIPPFLLAMGGPAAIEAALRSPAGAQIREEVAKAITSELVPVKYVVPKAYEAWRAPVRDAMTFVVEHLSAPRLAPKILEQLHLPPDTPPEARLLRLISKVPGLQKLGQVIARNHHLRPSLRRALIALENGIRDMTADEVRATIERELGDRISAHDIRIDSAILSEASVSAVVRFTWLDPSGGHRRRGVFKVLKPHVPEYFAEDMQILQDLADFFATHRTEYGPVARVLPDTFAKVRRLLQHEVDFAGEQATLRRAVELYRSMKKVRVPHLIPELSTPRITAMTEVPGAKIVDAAARVPARKRARIAERLVEALVAVPLFTSDRSAIFHADPHAGNLLYGAHSGELAIVDWALKEELTDEQRRRLALLTISVTLREPVGAAEQVVRLAEGRIHPRSRRARIVRDLITRYFDELPVTRIPGVVDAMRILELCALEGILFPGPLIMFSKMMFTLEDVLDDIGDRSSISTIMGRYLLSRLISSRSLKKSAVTLPLKKEDWLALPLSATFGALRLGLRIEQAAFEALLSRFESSQPESASAS